MPSTIKFDGTEILSTTYNPRFIKHESDPDIQINSLELPHEDGSIQVSDRTGEKTITVQGVLVGSSEADLESKIDAFKELFRRTNKQLDINWNSGTRRYVASCIKHTFDRDHFNIGFVPWSAEFLCPTGIAEETSETSLYANIDFTTQEYAWTPATFLGSAPPRPRIRVQSLVTATDPKGVELKNDDTGERLIFTNPGGLIASNITFDCRLKTVTGPSQPTAPMAYYGVFPKFKSGANNFRIRIADITAEGWEEGTTGSQEMPIYSTAVQPAQSFMLPFRDGTFQGINLYLRKEGTIATDITVTIESDNAGVPSGSAVATFTIPAAAFTDVYYDWRLANTASRFTLNANTKYWIKCATAGGDASNYYCWLFFQYQYATYKKGSMVYYTAGPGWIDVYGDAYFRVLFGGKRDGTKTIRANIDYYKRWL